MNIYSLEYDTNYIPSAPVAEIRVSKSYRSSVEVDLVALIDSGADATLLPINALQRVRAIQTGSRFMQGVTGTRISVDTYDVTISIGDIRLAAVDVVAINVGAEPILGRDVLNTLVVTLNGLASTTEIST